MTASRSDPAPSRRARGLLLLAPTLLLAACRAGLPPEPPGADPSDAAAPVHAYEPPANPYEVSAFAGDEAPAPGHEHMNHGAPKADAPVGHEPMNHGDATTSPKQPEAPR